jgi:signal transduction histidine kinase
MITLEQDVKTVLSERPPIDVVALAHEAAFENSDDSMFVLDEQDRIIYLNRIARQFVHDPSLQITGQPSTHVVSAWPALTERLQDRATDQAEISLGAGEKKREYRLRSLPLTDGARQLGRLVILQDVTEQKRSRGEQPAPERPAQANVDLARMLVHDLRTPLTTANGYTDLMLRGAAGTLSENQRRFIEFIKSSLEQMSLLLADLVSARR